MLQPKKRNYPKAQKGKVSFLPAVRGIACAPGNSTLSNFGLIALEPGRINNKQIEAARVALNRRIKRYGKLNFKIFPHIPVTKKPLEMRMGQGKGPIHTWIARVKTFHLLVEVSPNVPTPIALAGLRAASFKLPIRTKILLPHSII